MSDTNYWAGRVSRRGWLRGAGMAGAGLAGAALIGCGDDDDDAVTSATQAPAVEAKRGGELILSGGDLQKLDFQATISSATQVSSSLVFSRVLKYDPQTDQNDYVLQPDLAESWEVSEDKVILNLKKGVKWQNLDPMNGRELTSADVKYSLERVATDDPQYVHAYKVGPVASIDRARRPHRRAEPQASVREPAL